MPSRDHLIGGKFALADMALLHLGPIIFGGSDKIIAYLCSHGLLSSPKSCAKYLKIHEYIYCVCL